MQISSWDRIKSYFFDVVKESTSSDFNEILDVMVVKGRYQLCTKNAIYSYDDLYDNYRRSFERLPLDKLKIENVLILGLGLGSIPSMVEKKFNRHWSYTAVEIDDEVVRLAQKYVLSDLRSKIEIYPMDAALFMELNTRKFDIVCVDLFVDDIIPNKFQIPKFLDQVGRAVGDDGLVLYNRLARSKSDREKTLTFFNGPFKSVFKEATYMDVKGNYMLMNKSVT